jgi:hypothetical protein
MANSFTQRTLPDRTYGLVMPIGAMAGVGKEATIRKPKMNQRVELLVMTLSGCRLGRANSGIMKMSIGLLNRDQLTLAEEAVLAMHDSQRMHISLHSNFSHLIAGGLNSRNEHSPYDYIVDAVAGTFQRPALIAIRDFSQAHNNMGELIKLCTIMDQQGIELTKRNVAVQIVALHEAGSGRSKQDMFDHPYLEYPELIRAVHEHPKRIHDLLDLLRTRGDVTAATEIFTSSKAISEGAL